MLLVPPPALKCFLVSGREELTFEMLVLEPRASDDETLESEASIGTADSSENLNVEAEGALSEKPGEPHGQEQAPGLCCDGGMKIRKLKYCLLFLFKTYVFYLRSR